jgi:hypothetical protein
MANTDEMLRVAEYEFGEGWGREHDLGHGISVFVGEQRLGETRADVLCRVSQAGKVRNRKLRVANLSDVEAAGFRVVNTPPPPEHHDVDLGTIDPRGRLATLVALFNDPEENPCPFLG